LSKKEGESGVLLRLSAGARPVPPLADTSKITAAQQIVGAAMGACLSAWFAPFVGTAICNQTEREMMREVLRALGRDSSPETVNCLFWSVRKKLFFLNLTTFIPIAGTAAQVLEVYTVGQFTIYCAIHYENLRDEAGILDAWGLIEKDVLSGERVVRSYEEFSGQTFPAKIQPMFIKAVDKIRDAYRFAERSETFCAVQVAGGNVTRTFLEELKRRCHDVFAKVSASLPADD